MFNQKFPVRLYRDYGKILMDYLVAGFALLIFTPVLLAIAAMVRISIGAPALFSQERAGLRGRPFKIIKFRTMTDDRDGEGKLLPDVDRLTRFGRFLRSTSLDEMPELINVLRSEMSLVGPRPFFSKYLKLYTPEQMGRHDVRPGITGWAQVNGRNALTWEKKFEL